VSRRALIPQIRHADRETDCHHSDRAGCDQLARHRDRRRGLTCDQMKDSILEGGSWTIVGAFLEIATKPRLKRIFVNHGKAPAGKI
jgi:hypothetical protein